MPGCCQRKPAGTEDERSRATQRYARRIKNSICYQSSVPWTNPPSAIYIPRWNIYRQFVDAQTLVDHSLSGSTNCFRGNGQSKMKWRIHTVFSPNSLNRCWLFFNFRSVFWRLFRVQNIDFDLFVSYLSFSLMIIFTRTGRVVGPVLTTPSYDLFTCTPCCAFWRGVNILPIYGSYHQNAKSDANGYFQAKPAKFKTATISK